jgi:protein gp37
MAERTGIEWTDATVNFWWGCTKVGPGCDHCYAETWSARFGGEHWGLGAPRRKIKGAAAMLNRLDNDYAWWAADAQIGGYHPNSRRRVFIQSMSDLFDTEVPLEWFAEAWGKIVQCYRIDIQIVTKRISVVEKRLAAIGVTTWPKHAGLVVTVCNQDEANRDIPRLLALKSKLGIPWVGVSAEPLLGPIDFGQVEDDLPFNAWLTWLDGLDWVIVGGESGPTARPMHPDWARSIRDQCEAAGTPFFFKQWGEWGQCGTFQTMADGPYWPGNLVKEPAVTGLCRAISAVEGRVAYGSTLERVGKTKAGRVLDGVTHDAMPEVRHG